MGKRVKIIKFETPRKYQLNGLWFGGDNPTKAIVFIHGLTSNAFSNHKLTAPLSDKSTAVIYFSNRGSGKINKFKKTDKRKRKGYTSSYFGEAKELFTDCVDDIQGIVNYLNKKGVNNIFLVGHSTGCQKSIYYLSQRGKQKQISGVVLLCPVSDYSAMTLFITKEKLKKIVETAEKMVKKGEGDKLLPYNVWPQYHSAQRFLSLYTSEGEEEIFTYASDKEPKTLMKNKIPTLVIYAEKDEYHDRPTNEIAEWFKNNSKTTDLTIHTIKKAPHNFKNYEHKVVNTISKWLNR